MKNLGNDSDLREILARVKRLTPESQRRWGKMNVHQMICHVADAKRMMLGDKPVQSRRTWLARYVLRYGSLYLPMQWPHGFPTTPEANQEIGGTPPAEFERDRAELVALIQRFAGLKEFQPHPLFGPMSHWEWMRWGYLHPDHHLRQFGV